MENQKELWEAEYRSGGLPTSYRIETSAGAEVLVHFLRMENVPFSGRLLDLGCGAGRNGLYFARLGFEVYGMDISENALAKFQERAERLNLINRIRLHNKSISEKFPFQNNYFDVAFDANSFCHIVDDGRREVFKNEVSRVLKPDGYFLCYTMARDYGEISKMQDQNGVYTDPVNKTIGRLYSEKDLVEFFSPKFERIHSEGIKKEEIVHGQKVQGSLVAVVFQKK